jgi:hypothetical protein
MAVMRSVTAAVGAMLLALTASPASAGPPEELEDPFAYTTPDVENGLVVFVNTSREAFCTDLQVSRELAILAWLEAGMVDPFPEWALERPDGFETWTPMLNDTPRGAIVHLDESDQHLEAWWMDEPEDATGVGACTDSDDRLELFATGTVDLRAIANDFFGSGLRGASIEHFRGSGELTGVDGTEYRYRFSYRLMLPCNEPPGRPCEVFGSSLSAR